MALFGKISPTGSWVASPESDVAGYRIYIGTSPNTYTSNINTGNVTSYVISGLTPIQRWYYFAVAAYDATGNESVKSTEARFYISDPSTTEVISKVVAKRG